MFGCCRSILWGLPYYVKVDGRLVSPSLLPHIDWIKFATSLNVTSVQNTTYKFENGDSSTDYTDRFTIDLQYKLSSRLYHRLQTALELLWNNQYPG